MKKILLAALFISSSLLVFAQDQEDTFKGFKLGLTAHPNFGWIKSDIKNVKSNGLRAGFTYGLVGDFNFAQNYAFSTGLLLTTINGQTEDQSTALPASGEQRIYKLQYIEIPLKIKLSTNEDNGLRYYGEFGLGNAINVRAKQDIKNGPNATEDKDIYSEIAFYRASLIIGAGAEFKVGDKTALQTGLSFNNGFTDIRKGAGTLKSSYLGLNIGVFF